MAVENKLTGPSMEQRISARLRNSGAGAFPDVSTQHGAGPTRVHHNIHFAGHRPNPGTAARESGPQEQHRHDPATTQGVGYSPKGGDRQ